MAGLLSDILGAVDRAKQTAGANLSLLFSDPREFLATKEDQARHFNRLSNLAAQASINAMEGKPVTPEQAVARQYIDRLSEDISMGFAGTTKLGKTPFELAHEAAQANAVKMLGLPPGNTAMDRARALGFDDGWAHGSPRNDLTFLRPSRTGAQGPGAYATNYLPETGQYALGAEGASYPLMVRRSEALVSKQNNPYDEFGVKADDELLSEVFGRGKSAMITTQEATPDWLVKHGVPIMPERQHYVSVKPENFRSRFAAFDPARINEPDLLAAGIPLGLISGMDTNLPKPEKKKKDKK